MSPHGIARPQIQSSPNSGKKFPLARPLNMQNFARLWSEPIDKILLRSDKKCPRYPWSKICAPRKSGPKFTKIFQGMLLTKSPNQPKFCHNRLQTVGDIRDLKFVLPNKWAKILPKSLKTCYLLKPPLCQLSLRSVKPPWRKALQKFYTLQYFGSPGPKVTGLGVGVQQPLSRYLQNFVQFRRPLSEISAAKLRRFCCRRDPQKHTVNDMSLHYIRRQ